MLRSGKVPRRRDNSLACRRENPPSTVPRRCNIFTLGEGAANTKRRKRRRRATCRSSGRTFDNELYFPRRCVRSTWESRRVPEIDREVAGLARVLPRRLPSTFVALVAFIDSKSLVPSLAARPRWDFHWEAGGEVSLPTLRPPTFYAPSEKICRRRKLHFREGIPLGVGWFTSVVANGKRYRRIAS